MSEREEKIGQEASASGPEERKPTDPCTGIRDPVRRGLCRVCQAPVVGEAPFCTDHELPVP